MTLKLEHKELHEILCGLHKNTQRISARLRHTEAQIAEYTQGGGEDEQRLLYLNTLRTLREARLRTIAQLLQRLEAVEDESNIQ